MAFELLEGYLDPNNWEVLFEIFLTLYILGVTSRLWGAAPRLFFLIADPLVLPLFEEVNPAKFIYGPKLLAW